METMRGLSLLNNNPIFLEGWPESPVAAAGTTDEYVAPRATIAANHESLKSQGTVPHAAVMKQIEQIADNPSLTDKEKRAAINDLRKQLGLSKGDMKKFYTKPLERKAELEGNEEKEKLYASMYKAGGCVKKVFKGIGKGLATVGKVAAGVATAIVNPASLIPMAASLVSKIPGVSKVTNFVQSGLNKVTGWMDTGMGYVQKGVQFSKDIATIFGNFGS
jgi:hypothetical protein